jgi:ribosomal protein S18 acetylase RimI-like enzyme
MIIMYIISTLIVAVILTTLCISSLTEALVHQRPQFRLKTTAESDLHAITAILATAISKYADEGNLDWVGKINYLRSKGSLSKQLSSRLKVLELGHSVISKHYDVSSLMHKKYIKRLAEVTPMQICRLLLACDAFRWALEYAANCATDINVWTSHNFALPPDDPSMLQHAMITAYFDSTVVGFCEVAMLPSADFDESGIQCCYPSILNLVVSQNHRNQGLATKMVRSAIRLVRSHWINAAEIRLYVDKSNEIAMKLYRREKFVVIRELEDKFYLSKLIQGECSVFDSNSAVSISL